jgi:hypothetical protein
MTKSNRGGGDLFTPIPRRFHDALRRGDVNARQFLLGCYIAGEVDFRTGEVALTLDAVIGGVGWEWSEDTLLRDLKALRTVWIDFETRQGQRRPYVFRLTGLARASEADRTHDFRTETLSRAEVTSPVRKSERPANPQPERSRVRSQPPLSESPKKRRDEKRQETFSEEDNDPDVAEGTTSPEREPLKTTERMLETLRAIDSESPGVGAEIERARAAAELSNRTPGVRVEVADDGSLEWWPPEPEEGEAAFLAECQALVDAGLAEWREEATPA